jgi:hypothetical protein
MRVRNMTSNRSGREIANQFIIKDDNGYTYFQSYQSIIIKQGHGETILDSYSWDYSTTTGKYRNQFLGETKKDTERKIANGTYKLANLN